MEDFTFGKSKLAINIARMFTERQAKNQLPFDFVRKFQRLHSSYGKGLSTLCYRLSDPSEKGLRLTVLKIWRDKYLNLLQNLLDQQKVDDVLGNHLKNLFCAKYKNLVSVKKV